jgi:hypothetical protein
MTFIARLFGFVVVMILIAAMGLAVIDKVPDSIVELSSSAINGKVVDLVELESSDLASQGDPRPLEHKSVQDSLQLVKVEVNDVEGLKNLIFREGEVIVVVNNQYLKNPFLEKVGVFPIVLIGYDRTHFYSSGAEIGSNSFVYLFEDFKSAMDSSGSSVWILKE